MRFLPLLLLAAIGVFGRDVRVTVLATTDLHGNIYPWDYLTGKPAERGLAKLATLIDAERKANPNNLLIDVGDTIQGAALESVWQPYVRTGKLPLNVKFTGPAPTVEPMMLVMNHIGYTAMVLGNHEFNFGLTNLDKARAAAKFPWLSANTKASGSRKPFQSYLIKEIAGVKIAIIGITTPAVPTWEKPENYKDYTFTDAKTAVTQAIAELKAKHKPDLVIVAAHAGLERDLKTGASRPGAAANENMVYTLATEVPGIDAIIYGHSHQTLEDGRLGDVLLMQPRNWGMSLGKLEFELESKPEGGWRIQSKAGKLIPVTKDVAADPEILRLAQPYHDITERYLNTPVANAATALDASESRIEDSAMIDAIQKVQLHYSKADVSFTSSFNPSASIPKGQITVRQIAALYVYDNELYAIEGNGRMVRDALENSARYFNSCADPQCAAGPLINRSVIGFNYDIAQGISYSIDLTKPAGQRIVDLTYKGQPLKDDQKLRIAVNNYRAGGSGGYTMFRDAPVLWRSYEEIRDLIIRYYSEHPFPSTPDDNWRIVPETAHQTLEREVRRDYRPLTQ